MCMLSSGRPSRLPALRHPGAGLKSGQDGPLCIADLCLPPPWFQRGGARNPVKLSKKVLLAAVARTTIRASVRAPPVHAAPNPKRRYNRSRSKKGNNPRSAAIWENFQGHRSPVIPLDVLYEVIHGLIHVADGMPADAFVDILSCPSSGSTADVVDKQDLSQHSHEQVLEADLGSRFR